MSLRPFEQLLAEPSPEFLYHYTSALGLCGMIQSDSIWASKIQHLNDSTELLLALRICEMLLRNESHRQPNPWTKQLIEYAIETLKRIKLVNICICSFSEKNDLLSQWRGYCPQEGGYNIGIPGSHLTTTFGREKFTLIRCVYDDKTQNELVQDTLDVALPELFTIPVSSRSQMQIAAEPVIQRLHLMLMEIAPIIKNPGFAEESEWRAVSGPIAIGHNRIKLRAQGNVIRPYYELPLDLRNINIHVTTGPCRYPDLARESCFMLIEKAGLQSFAVSGSVIPFRVI